MTKSRIFPQPEGHDSRRRPIPDAEELSAEDNSWLRAQAIRPAKVVLPARMSELDPAAVVAVGRAVGGRDPHEWIRLLSEMLPAAGGDVQMAVAACSAAWSPDDLRNGIKGGVASVEALTVLGALHDPAAAVAEPSKRRRGRVRAPSVFGSDPQQGATRQAWLRRLQDRAAHRSVFDEDEQHQ